MCDNGFVSSTPGKPRQGVTMLKNIRLERPLVVLDLETTGKNVQSDRIVEISTIRSCSQMAATRSRPAA